MTYVLLTVLALGSGAFDQARVAYQQGRYAEALALFEVALAEGGVPEAAVLHAMGNCAARTGDLSRAAWYYRRALLRRPRDRGLLVNLESVEKRLGVLPAEPTAFVGAARWWRGLAPWGRLWLVVSLQCAGLFAVAFARHGRVRKLGSTILLIGTLGAALVVLDAASGPGEAVIIAPSTSASGASPDVDGRFVLRAGECVVVETVEGDRVLVRHAGRLGWVDRSTLGFVE